MPELDLTKISKLEERLDDVISKYSDEDEEGDGEKAFMAVLKDACALIRDAESEGVANLDIAIEQVDKLIDKALNFAYGDSEMFDFVPSFAHSNECPVLEDEIDICTWKKPSSFLLISGHLYSGQHDTNCLIAFPLILGFTHR